MTPKHSNLGPSSAERWFSCPGSVSATIGLPSSKSYAAAEGTVAHELCEEFVTGKMSGKALAAKEGRVTQQEGFEVLVTDEMIEAVIAYKDLIDSDTKREKASLGQAEVRVIASSISKKLYGTSDYILIASGRKLVVYDFKYGKKAVNPEKNKQMAIYAIATIDTLLGGAENFDGEIELVIVQPRAGKKMVRRWAVPALWLGEFTEELRAAVLATEDPLAPRKIGSWCFWCSYEPQCPEAHQKRLAQAVEDFA